MDGMTLAKAVEEELKRQGISKGDFYKAVGISATAMYGWKRGAEPKKETIKAIEKYLNINFSDIEKSDESDELREMLRDRQDLRILLHSAKDVPASSIYALISQIEKMNEDAN